MKSLPLATHLTYWRRNEPNRHWHNHLLMCDIPALCHRELIEMKPYEPKPKPIVFGLRLFRKFPDHRVLILGRLYVGYVGLILTVPNLISIDLWFLNWEKDYKPS